MKRISTFITLLLIAFTISFGQIQYNFTGLWEGADQTGTKGSFEFKADSTVVFAGVGEEFIFEKYRIIADTKPIQIVLYAKFEDKPAELYCLIEFLDENKLKIEIFPDFNQMDCPKQFSETDQNQIILDRVIPEE
jgi:hypothetical protein